MQGIDPSSIRTTARGEAGPVASYATETGRYSPVSKEYVSGDLVRGEQTGGVEDGEDLH